jgi:hypothetical protein
MVALAFSLFESVIVRSHRSSGYVGKARRSPEWLKVSPEELVAALDWACLDFQKG